MYKQDYTSTTGSGALIHVPIPFINMVDQPRENNTTYPGSKPKQCCQMTSADVLLLSATLKNMLSIIMKKLSDDT